MGALLYSERDLQRDGATIKVEKAPTVPYIGAHSKMVSIQWESADIKQLATTPGPFHVAPLPKGAQHSDMTFRVSML